METPPMTPTADEIQRVKRYECQTRGYHRWTYDMQDALNPTSFTCETCNRRVDVVQVVVDTVDRCPPHSVFDDGYYHVCRKCGERTGY